MAQTLVLWSPGLESTASLSVDQWEECVRKESLCTSVFSRVSPCQIPGPSSKSRLKASLPTGSRCQELGLSGTQLTVHLLKSGAATCRPSWDFPNLKGSPHPLVFLQQRSRTWSAQAGKPIATLLYFLCRKKRHYSWCVLGVRGCKFPQRLLSIKLNWIIRENKDSWEV